MAVVTRNRPSPTLDRPAGAPAPSSFTPVTHSCEREAPDRGEVRLEAPETRIGRHTEAPDAGEGRAALVEHEFTHGRSQS